MLNPENARDIAMSEKPVMPAFQWMEFPTGETVLRAGPWEYSSRQGGAHAIIKPLSDPYGFQQPAIPGPSGGTGREPSGADGSIALDAFLARLGEGIARERVAMERLLERLRTPPTTA